MRPARPTLRSDESGFTLVELLLAMTIGLIILGSATMVSIGAARHNGEVANRIDATQRGRLAMERMTQLIRSQVCVTATDTPITDARANSITLTSDLSDGTTRGPSGTPSPTTPRHGSCSTPSRPAPRVAARLRRRLTSELATDVVTQTATTPIFRYYAYPEPAADLRHGRAQPWSSSRPLNGTPRSRHARAHRTRRRPVRHHGRDASTKNIRAAHDQPGLRATRRPRLRICGPLMHMTRLHKRLAGEGGFTLAATMGIMLISSIICLAAFQVAQGIS